MVSSPIMILMLLFIDSFDAETQPRHPVKKNHPVPQRNPPPRHPGIGTEGHQVEEASTKPSPLDTKSHPSNETEGRLSLAKVQQPPHTHTKNHRLPIVIYAEDTRSEVSNLSTCHPISRNRVNDVGCDNTTAIFPRTPSCTTRICERKAFGELASFVARTAYIGAVVCASTSLSGSVKCKCFFPGLGQCRSSNASDQVAFIGDSTLRQLSFAWDAAHDQNYISSVMDLQEAHYLPNGSSYEHVASLTQTLCYQSSAHFYDDKKSTPSYTDAFRGHIVVPNVKPVIKRVVKIAVFNFGLHLLGGYVDPHRWKTHWAKSFISDYKVNYDKVLKEAARSLKVQGFSRVVYKTTNAIAEDKYFGDWAKATLACKHESAACNHLVHTCIEIHGASFSYQCRHLSFDYEGAVELNRVSGEALYNSSEAGWTPRDFFTSGDALVDGVIDAHATTKLHPECCPDGRHYFQLELTNARILHDALGFWI